MAQSSVGYVDQQKSAAHGRSKQRQRKVTKYSEEHGIILAYFPLVFP